MKNLSIKILLCMSLMTIHTNNTISLNPFSGQPKPTVSEQIRKDIPEVLLKNPELQKLIAQDIILLSKPFSVKEYSEKLHTAYEERYTKVLQHLECFLKENVELEALTGFDLHNALTRIKCLPKMENDIRSVQHNFETHKLALLALYSTAITLTCDETTNNVLTRQFQNLKDKKIDLTNDQKNDDKKANEAIFLQGRITEILAQRKAEIQKTPLQQ